MEALQKIIDELRVEIGQIRHDARNARHALGLYREMNKRLKDEVDSLKRERQYLEEQYEQSITA